MISQLHEFPSHHTKLWGVCFFYILMRHTYSFSFRLIHNKNGRNMFLMTTWSYFLVKCVNKNTSLPSENEGYWTEIPPLLAIRALNLIKQKILFQFFPLSFDLRQHYDNDFLEASYGNFPSKVNVAETTVNSDRDSCVWARITNFFLVSKYPYSWIVDSSVLRGVEWVHDLFLFPLVLGKM